MALVLPTALPTHAQEPDGDDEPSRLVVTDKELGFELLFYQVRPPTINFDERPYNLVLKDGPIAADPTIIPFSGWAFGHFNGENQLWRRRHLPTTKRSDASGGQTGTWLHWRKHFSMLAHYRYPKKINLQHIKISPTHSGIRPNRANIGTFSMGQPSGKHHQLLDYTSSYQTLDLLPDFLSLKGTVAQGEWDVVADYKPGDPLPVGNDQVQLEYFGKPRANTALYQSLQNRGTDMSQYTAESHFTEDYSEEEWHYKIAYFNKAGKTFSFRNHGLKKNSESYWLSIEPLDQTHRIRIQRLPCKTITMQQIEFGPVVERWEEETFSRRLDITLDHRFDQPKTLNAQTKGPASKCLIDLDKNALITMPDKVLRDTALAKLAEENGADLLLGYKRGKATVQALGCTFYPLSKDAWEQSPADCLDAIKAKVQSPEYTFAIKDIGTPYLVTTCDGSMVLLRFNKVEHKQKGKPADIALQIRHLIEPDNNIKPDEDAGF